MQNNDQDIYNTVLYIDKVKFFISRFPSLRYKLTFLYCSLWSYEYERFTNRKGLRQDKST